MISDFSKGSIQKYLQELASRAVSPGGGSAAALVAATGIALVEMTAGINAKRKNIPADALAPARLRELQKLRKEVSKIISEDAKIFSRLGPSFQKPKESSVYQNALKKSAELPFRICEISFLASEIALPEIGRTSRWLASDLAEAGILLEAAFYSGRLNVETNLKNVLDKKYSRKVSSDLDKMERKITSHRTALMKVFNA